MHRHATLNRGTWLATLAAVFVLAGCGDDPPPPEPQACTGEIGCACDVEVACDPGLVCGQGVCRTTCLPGVEGCGCLADNLCASDIHGRQLACTDGACALPACAPGDVGCDCDEGECGGDAVCSDASGVERCEVDGCELGTSGCGCELDRTCALGAGLACVSGTCQSTVCEPGVGGCVCEADFGCDTGLVCGADETCEPIGCTPGSIGCACDGSGECDASDGYCDEDDRCQRSACPAGEVGCACLPDDSCASALTCQAGVCGDGDCSPGDTACACLSGSECSESDAVCSDGLCLVDGCTPGERHCRCSGGACGSGLFCEDRDVCVDNDGHAGGSCLDDGSCTRGNRCQSEVCRPCLLGSLGCGCRDDDSCQAPLACLEGACVNETGFANATPSDAACSTRCTGDTIDADGELVRCQEGLMAGCFNGTTCVAGECLAAGSEPTTCATAIDCPLHNDCLLGHCTPNCDEDADCQEGADCHLAVCRLTCEVNETACGSGEYCSSSDGETGVCLPNAPPDPDPLADVFPFAVFPRALNLSNTLGTTGVQITNEGATDVTFLVAKTAGRTFDDAGASPTVRLTADGGCGEVCPLEWLEMTVEGEAVGAATVELTVEAGETVTVDLSNATTVDATRWEGSIEISHPSGYTQTVQVSQSQLPEGQWAGEVVHFGNFDDHGLATWDGDEVASNALVNVWASFRDGAMSVREFGAILTSIRSESWRYRSMRDLCGEGRACAPFDNGNGYTVISNNTRSESVPSAAVALPFRLNLHAGDADDCDGSAHCFVGRIESDDVLHYPGNPEFELVFEDGPGACTSIGAGGCVARVARARAEIVLGGRYTVGASESCPDGFDRVRLPWLVAGFLGAAQQDPDSGRFYTYECRDTRLPFDDPDTSRSLSGGNPVLDGRVRRRTLEVIDGALVNNHTIFLLVAEYTDSFLSDEEDAQLVSYGYVMLAQTDTQLDAAEYLPTRPTVPSPESETDNRRPVECSEDLLETMGRGAMDFDDGGELDGLFVALIDGINHPDPGGGITASLPLVDEETEFTHYLCVDTGLFDGYDGAGNRSRCPEGSPVVFFTIDHDQAWLIDRPCQDRLDTAGRAACGETLQNWIDEEDHSIRVDPFYACSGTVRVDEETVESPPDSGIFVRRQVAAPRSDLILGERTRVYCDTDRWDLRTEKVFYAAASGEQVFKPYSVTLERAFQYRLQFMSRGGDSGVGFVPQICESNNPTKPYCYDPDAIAELLARTECALWLYNYRVDELSPDFQAELTILLQDHLAFQVEITPLNERITHFGFEHLYAELLIMLGDESFTQALASRFDLAELRVSDFEGSQFEPGGIDLSGVAGAEMVALYRAAQYYESVLNRFHELGPELGVSIERARESGNPDDSVLTADSVSSYLSRVLRASTQKARTWAEVARRYQNLNRPDLARRAIERAYVAGHLESVAMSELFRQLTRVLDVGDIDQVEAELIRAQRSYRVALGDMREVYGDITNEITYFGFAPEWLPFPAVELGRDNAFETAMFRARDRLEIARTAEDLAIESDRTFNTDAAAFQSELARIRTTYDRRLSELCGTLEVEGEVFPATARYASLHDDARALGDPCGLMGTGAIFTALGDVSISLNELRRVHQQMDNLLAELDIEETRIVGLCGDSEVWNDGVIGSFADVEYTGLGTINNLQLEIDRLEVSKQHVERLIGDVMTSMMIQNCNIFTTECASATIGQTIFSTAADVRRLAVAGMDVTIVATQADVRNLQRDLARDRTLHQCTLAEIDSEARLDALILRMAELQLEALRAQYELGRTTARADQSRNQAVRLMGEQEEMEQLSIDMAAARNDPNIRIYKNDAIRNADVSFYLAVQEAYKATRVVEYYTSSSFPDFDKLFLVRMVSRGEFNLSNYLISLEDYFRAFEDEFGVSDLRLARLSLRDDIMGVPLHDERGEALTESERISILRERLTDGTYIDEQGYISVPFNTTLSMVSPLTANHKVAWVEVELMGSDLGDPLGRVYLRMAGTSTIQTLRGDPTYYRLPQRTAVINSFFNGNRVYADSTIYKTRRLVDRPFLNTRWELVLNTIDEEVNEDINLGSLTDIRLYLYYRDFTEF